MTITIRRSLWQCSLRLLCILFVGPGAAVSQLPQDELCTSPIAIGSRVFIADIPEDLPVGSTVGNLQLRGSTSEIFLRYVEPHNDAVIFDPVSQNLTTIAPLNKEAYDFIDIEVECEMIAQGFRIPVPVKISILDVNDNPPEFMNEPYATNISELMPVGTTVLSGISARDLDADNWKITFEILDDGPFSTYFTFPIETGGNIVLTKQLDYELVHSIELHIVAKDHHPDVLGRPQTQLNSTTVAVIQLYDGDDQNPAFTSNSYLAYVTENAPVGTLIGVQPSLLAYDQDLGLNATVSYSLIPDTIRDRPQSSYFIMDNATGILSLGDDVLRRGEQFCLMVQATQVNNPNRYSMTSLFIFVQAANENQPRFVEREYVIGLVENVPVNSYVTTVTAVDNDVGVSNKVETMTLPSGDEGTILTYTFTNPLLVTDFTINMRSGEIRTSRDLLFERTPRYNISIVVTDGKWFDYTFLVVELHNINNHNPVFNRRSYTFQGHKEPNFFIGSVQATDLDVDSALTYKLAENSSQLSMRPNGEIYLNGDVSKISEDDVITMCVIAEDEGKPARRDVTVAKVSFGAGVGPVTAAGQADLVIIIILGVLSGCLLLIIAVLSIYIYRNSVHPTSSPTHSQPYTTDDQHIDAYFESSKSFERAINELPSGYENTYANPSEGVYTPHTKDRHASLYSDINMSRDGTTTQENPFHVDNESDPGTSYRTVPRSTDGKNSFAGYSSQSLRPSNPGSSSYSVGRSGGMHGVNEIDYHTATEPMDNVSSATVGKYPTYSSQSESDPSFAGSGHSLGTFKVGNSTQALVGAHSPPSSVGYRGKAGSSVSFIDDHQVNVYHPENAINPATGRSNRDKPEITVYY